MRGAKAIDRMAIENAPTCLVTCRIDTVMNQRRQFDDDDHFATTRMTFGEHLEDLRYHLIRALIGFGFCMVIGFILDAIGTTGLPVGVGKPTLEIIARPVEIALQDFYDRRVTQVKKDLAIGRNPELQADNLPQEMMLDVNIPRLRDALGIKDEYKGEEFVALPVRVRPVELAISMNTAHKHVGKRPGLSTLSVQEALMVYIWVSLMCGLVLSSPWVFWQIWSFIAAGLYPKEKRYVHVYLPFSLVLFLSGILLCQFIVMPQAVKALLWFNEWIGLEPELRLNEWLSFALITPLVFGISFQTPIVMLFLERLGIFDIDTFRNNRRLAWFIMAIFAAFVTPTIDPSGMLFMWVPMGLLYELGIYLIKLSPRSQLDVDVPDSEEMVEV